MNTSYTKRRHIQEANIKLESRFLNKDDKQNILESSSQENVRTAYEAFKKSVARPGTDEQGLVDSVKLLKSKQEFSSFLELFKDGQTGYKSFIDALNGELGKGDLDYANELFDYIIKINGKGFNYTYDNKNVEDFRFDSTQKNNNNDVSVNTQTNSSRLITTSDTDFATAFNTNKKIMTIGSKGDLVKKVQNFLLKNGFSVGNLTKDIEGCKNDMKLCDGIYGKETYNSVKNYQTNKSLKSKDGIIGPETAKSMGLLDNTVNQNKPDVTVNQSNTQNKVQNNTDGIIAQNNTNNVGVKL